MMRRSDVHLPDVIDLTSDPEEADTYARATRQPSSKSNTGTEDWRRLTTSNHGLPDPEEFRSRNRNRDPSSRVVQSTGSSSTSLMSEGSTSKDRSSLPWIDLDSKNPSQNQAPQRQYSPILPGATVRSRQVSRVHKNGDAGMSTSMHTDNGLKGQAIAHKNGQYPQIYRSMATSSAARPRNLGYTSRRSENGEQQKTLSNQNSNGCLVDSEKEDISLTYSPLRPTPQPSDLKRRKFHGSFQSQNTSNNPAIDQSNHFCKEKEPPPILPHHKTIITGASRAVDSASPTVFLNRAASQSSQSKSPQKPGTTEMLGTQVIPHITKAISKHRGTLPQAQLHKIATEASTPAIDTVLKLTPGEVIPGLVEEPGFLLHLAANNNTLSRNYEQKFARTAQDRVDREVDHCIRAAAAKSIPPEDSSMLDVQITDPELNHATPTSADSPDSVEIFETSHVPPKLGQSLTGSRIRDTSSPATSFSNGRADSRQLSEDDEDDNQMDPPKRSVPSRVTRGASKKDYYPWKKTQKLHSSKQKTIRSSRQHSKQASDNDEVTKGEKELAPAKRVRVAKKNINAEPPHPPAVKSPVAPSSRDKVQLMIRQRELHGMTPVGLRTGKLSYKTMATNALEDSLVREHQWASQSGDAVTITWTGQFTFVSGALTHYDVHNMQYNRYGNLVVGSTSSRTVNMVDGHRTLRPIVTPEENKENSLPAMRATQDDWRYAPVVSSAYCEVNGHTFTASYDKTVKIWKVSDGGPSMELQGIWEHDFFVNFVVTSKHHDKIATASEAHNDAVRVYTFDETDVSQSAYDVYNAGRALDRPGDLRMADSWAYHPATMQWGQAEKVSNLLLVGYSPRGTTIDDEAIPDTKKNSGELCCWNVSTGEQVPINASKSQNVFEVIWHPSQPIFLVAAAPSGTYDTKRTKTQVRLFQLQGVADLESFQCIKTLDCPASDVNELTIMPTSMFGGYVTASCTDGRTYVWDTMHEDRVLHVLAHGESIDNPDPDIPLELADSGVKFAAWGQSANRFYTGSSDGVVKVWDITQAKRIFVRDILRAQGGIACGVFSSDFMQLLIGDATGHLHLIRALDDDSDSGDPLMLPISRRKIIIPHADPEPPQNAPNDNIQDESVEQVCRKYLKEGVLREFTMDLPGFDHLKKVGQGPNYGEVAFFRDELHVDGDHNKPLLLDVAERNKAHQTRMIQSLPRKKMFPVLLPVKSSKKRHQRADDLDLDIKRLLISNPSEEFRRDLEISEEYLFDFED